MCLMDIYICFATVNYLFTYLLCMCLCLRMGVTDVPQHMCTGQRIICGSGKRRKLIPTNYVLTGILRFLFALSD